MSSPSASTTRRADVLELRYEAAVAWMHLADTENGNRLTPALVGALHTAIDELATRDDVRVVVLAAHGDDFCRGHAVPTTPAPRAECLATCDLMLRLASLPCITVAAAHGMVADAGIELVASCDLALGAASARFLACDPTRDHWPHTTQVALSRALAPRQAFELLLDRQARDAATVARSGLLHAVVPDAQLDDAVAALAARLAAWPPETLARGKQAFARQLAMNRADAYDYALDQLLSDLRREEAGTLAEAGPREP
ncbi:MAG: enoyl-CoA hydratase-related protein [Gammaproteobacteria bacterium]